MTLAPPRLIDVQRRYTTIGEIRLGEKRTTGDGKKSYPAKLETFRLTSKSLDAIKAVAERYGGSVERWPDGDAYQVITETDRLPIMLPPASADVRPYSLSYELWSGGGLQRRCDGQNALIARGDQMIEADCMCNPDQRECHPTLRVGMFLPEVSGFGTWRLASTGFNAAAELPGMLDLLGRIGQSGQMVHAVLRLEQRTSKKGGQTRKFAVPVLDLPYTLAELAGPALPGPTNGQAQIGMNTQADGPGDRATSPTGVEQSAAPEEQAAGAVPARSEAAAAPDLDAPFADEELARWLAGTHAAIAERIPAGTDQHEALRSLAEAVVQLGERSLNDLTAREWSRLARAISAIPIAEPEQATAVTVGSGAEPSGEAAPATPPAKRARRAKVEAEPASSGPAPAPAPSDDELRARYAAAAALGFGDEALEEAMLAATGLSPLDAPDGAWQAFLLTLQAKAIAPEPPKPGSQAYHDLADVLQRAAARAYWKEH